MHPPPPLPQARECILTKSHMGLAMEYVSGGNLTEYVTNKWESTPSRNGLFLAEDEARYFFKVRALHGGAKGWGAHTPASVCARVASTPDFMTQLAHTYTGTCTHTYTAHVHTH